jgi:hypothetical protein
MSVGGSKSSSKNQAQQQATSQQSLDPDIKSALLGNFGHAQDLVAGSSYKPVGASDIAGFSNPFTSGVIDTTNSNLDLQRQQQLEQNAGAAVASHAFGGDRATVADALTNEAFDRTKASTDAGLNAADFQQALGAAQTQNTAQNAYPLTLQELLNASLGLAGNPVLGQSQSTGSSSGSGSTYSASYGIKPPGAG